MKGWFEFESSVVLLVSGKDARRYLNARLTNDIKSVAVGQSVWAAQLNAQGRTEGYFLIACLKEDRFSSQFLLACPGGDPEGVLTAFRRYIVADRVDIQDLSEDAKVTFLFCDPEDLPADFSALGDLQFSQFVSLNALDPGQESDATTIYGVKTKQRVTSGYELIALSPSAQLSVRSSLASCALESWSQRQFDLFRMKAGIPIFGQELTDQHLFLEARLMEAVSFKKGCYVGQEVVERVDSQGALPRTLGRFVSLEPFEVAVGQPLFLDSELKTTVGEILSWVKDPETNAALGFASVRSKYLTGSSAGPLALFLPGGRCKFSSFSG